MAARKMQFTADEIARAKWEYEETDIPVEAIADGLGCSKSTFHLYVKKWRFEPRLLRAPRLRRAAERSIAATGTADGDGADADVSSAISPDEVAATHARLLRLVKQTLARLEDTTQPDKGDDGTAQAERISRVAANLARTLQELTRMRSRRNARQRSRKPTMTMTTCRPRDIDEFRRELARRIEAFVARESQAALSGQPE